MSNTLVRQRPTQTEPTGDSTVATVAIEKWVLKSLGHPPNLFRVDVKPVWNGHFRVNVLCENVSSLSVGGLLITDSFFVTNTPEGPVSDPVMTKKYR